MADGNGKPYYWESMDINTTGENVGVVLDSLCDIVADNDLPASGKDTVKWVPGTEGKKGYFELGDGGGIIPGNEDQLVAADGQGKAKANISMFYSKYDSANSQSILQSPTPYVQFKSTSNAEESYYGYSHPMKLSMEWAPLLQFIGSNQYGSPVLSMNGRGIVDIFGGRPGSYNPINTARQCSYDTKWISYQAYNYYDSVYSPFDTTKKLSYENLIYPLLQFKDSSTVLMEGCSLLHMSGGSSLFMDGNADVRINGSYVNHGNQYDRWGRTLVDINPGSTFVMTSSYRGGGTETTSGNTTDYVPAFLMTAGGVEPAGVSGNVDGQIILTCQKKPTFDYNDSWSTYDRNHIQAPGLLNFIGMSNDLELTGSTSFGNDLDTTRNFPRSKLVCYEPDKGRDYYVQAREIKRNVENVEQPTLVLQGATNFTIGDQGKIGARMCANTGGNIAIDWSSYGQTGIKIGNKAGSISTWEIMTAAGVNEHIIWCPEAGSQNAISFNPHGMNSFYFSPGNMFGMMVVPQNTDICCQWGVLDAVFNSRDTYIDMDGNNRFEFRDEAIIHMKGTNHKSDQRYYKHTNTSTPITFISTTDYSGMTVQDLSSADYEEFINALEAKEVFSQKKWRYESGGDITSEEYYPDRYSIVVEGFTRTYYGSSDTFYVYSSNYYGSAFALQNSTDYQNQIKSKFGPNAVVTNLSIRSREYSWGNYYYYLNGTVSNASCAATCTTEYALDTPYADLSASDKSKFAFKSWTSTAAKVISNDVRSDMKYYISVTNFKYHDNTQLGEDWAAPIQQREKGPVFQMYDNSNICMRNKDVNSSAQFTYMLNGPVETYDFTQSQYEVITQFLNSADYTTFLANASFLTDNNLSEIISLAEGDEDNPGTKLFITYTQKWEDKENHVIGNGTDPVIEMTGGSELRLYNGATIKAITEWDKTTITFSGTQDEGEVSFTIDELRALKDLLIPQ